MCAQWKREYCGAYLTSHSTRFDFIDRNTRFRMATEDPWLRQPFRADFAAVVLAIYHAPLV